jgi:hypothetical protein
MISFLLLAVTGCLTSNISITASIADALAAIGPSSKPNQRNFNSPSLLARIADERRLKPP